ncbi:PaaI family thioesterase [Acuticoccus sp.]|uniref:PaaI family thioesterase n=1 Tax=Acuticoccus sp. TaxID=1904378 RepID=UPI003B5174BC
MDDAADHEGWREWRGDGFMDLVGPVLIDDRGEVPRYALRAEARHLNAFGIVHGGVIMTFLDHVVGMNGSRFHDGIGQATIHLGVSFVTAVQAGSLIVAECEVTRTTRSILFLRGTARVDGTVVATAEGVWKITNRGKVSGQSF